MEECYIYIGTASTLVLSEGNNNNKKKARLRFVRTLFNAEFGSRYAEFSVDRTFF